MQADLKAELNTHLIANGNVIHDDFLGDIIIKKRIGEGGNGVVHLAYMKRDTKELQPLAIKFLTNIETNKTERFIDEYLNPQLAGLTHIAANIQAGILRFEPSIEIPYILMKRYSMSLEGWLQLNPISNNEQAIRILDFLLDSVEELHNNNIIHRDLKPQNVLIDHNEKLLLADFGIASYADELYANVHKTRKGERLANREYAAPEQSLTTAPHYTMDIYAIAQIIHRVCNGKIYRDSGPVHIPLLNTFNDVFAKCLLQNPNDRPQSINELRQLLKEADCHTAMLRQNQKDVAACLAFHEVCRGFAPENGDISNISDPKRIKFLFSSLFPRLMNSMKLRLISVGTDFSDYDISGIKCSETLTLKLGEQRFQISDIWVIRDSRCSIHDNDFMLIHHIPYSYPHGKSMDFFYDGKIITENEYNNNYILNDDGSSEKMDYDRKELVEYIATNGYLAIGATQNRFQHRENEEYLQRILKKMGSSNTTPTPESITTIRNSLHKNRCKELYYFS